MSTKQLRTLVLILLTVMAMGLSPRQASAQVDPVTAGLVQEDLRASWHDLLPVYPDAPNQTPSPLAQSIHEFLHSAVAVARDGSFCTLTTFQMGAAGQIQLQAVVIKYSATGERLWHKVYGERGGAYGTGIVVDDNGNVYISGRMDITGGRNGRSHGFAASITPDGRERWVYLEHEQHDASEARSLYFNLAVTSNAVLLVGTGSGMVAPGAERDTRSSIIVTRLSTNNGRRVWTRLIEPDNEHENFDPAPGIAVTPQGLICITANKFLSVMIRGVPDRNQTAYVVMLSANGEVVRAAQVGISHLPDDVQANDVLSAATAITSDAQGSLYIVGYVSNRNEQPARPRPGQAAPPPSPYGMFVTKVSSIGQTQWTHVFGEQTAQFEDSFVPGRVQIGPNGEIWVYGQLGNHFGRPTILRLDDRGEIALAQAFSESSSYRTFSISLTPDGRGALVHGMTEPARERLLFADDPAARRHEPARPAYFFTARLDLEP